MLEPYIYFNLKIYGNTVINRKTYRTLGEKTILKDLAEHGFDCYITIEKYFKMDAYDPSERKPSVIIHVKGR